MRYKFDTHYPEAAKQQQADERVLARSMCRFLVTTIVLSTCYTCILPVACMNNPSESLSNDPQDEFLKGLMDERGEYDTSLTELKDIEKASGAEQFERENDDNDIDVTGAMKDGPGMLDSESFSDRAALKSDTDEETVNVDRRAFWQLCSMMSFKTGQSCTKYANYGCWCGIGGKGRAVDSLDRCCQAHDQCYDNKLGGCLPTSYFRVYNWKKSGSNIICSSDSSKCKYNQCVCDKEFANCLPRYKHLYNSEYTGLAWLLKKIFKC